MKPEGLLDTLLWYGVPIALLVLCLLILIMLVLIYRQQAAARAQAPTPVIPLANPPAAWLTRQDKAGISFPITMATCRIGRSADNELMLDNGSVYAPPRQIRRTFDGQFILHDKGSTNGVYVNDRKIISHKLADGDVIEIGDIFLRFTLKPSKAAKARAS